MKIVKQNRSQSTKIGPSLVRKFDLNIEKRPEKIIPKKPREEKEIKKNERAETPAVPHPVIHSSQAPRATLKETAAQPIIK